MGALNAGSAIWRHGSYAPLSGPGRAINGDSPKSPEGEASLPHPPHFARRPLPPGEVRKSRLSSAATSMRDVSKYTISNDPGLKARPNAWDRTAEGQGAPKSSSPLAGTSDGGQIGESVSMERSST